MRGALPIAALLGCAACGAPPPSSPPGGGPPPVAAAPLPGDALHYRFVDHAAEAEVKGELAAAWRRVPDHPQRSLLPYAPFGGEPRAVQIAFADSDVEDYATARQGGRAPRPVRAFDPVWNRTRAVYLSRQALYVPEGAGQRYRLRLPRAPRLETELGLVAPPGGRATFRVTVDEQVVLERTIERPPGAPPSWRGEAVDLAPFAGRSVTLGFSVDGAGAHGFFADPLVVALGEGAPGPNLIVVLIDTLRRDALPVMPRLMALAARGARFDQAISAATWTRPSLLALYGGDLPSAVGQSAEEMIPDEAARQAFYRLAPPLLPRLLHRRGYQVSAIGNNFFFLAYPKIGLDLGFATVDDIRHPVLDTPAIARAAERFLEAHKGRAFALHLHFDAPHWPYTPPDEYLARTRAFRGDAALQKDPDFRRYLAEAAYADDYLGRILDALARLGLDQRTLVVVVGDHGEIFDRRHDHVVVALGQPTLHHHGWSAYDEVLRVPLVLAYPGRIAPQVVPTQVSLVDVAPTALDYLGLGLGERLGERGRSLRPLVEGRERADRLAIAEGQNVRALRDGGYLYLARGDGRLAQGAVRRQVDEELYDLGADPAQHDNLALTLPAVRERLRSRLLAELPTPPVVPDPVVYHLRLAGDKRPHRVEGTIRLVGEGRLSVRGLAAAAATAVDEHTVRVRLDGRASLDLAASDAAAPLELALTYDGLALPQRRLLVGAFALPLLDGSGPIREPQLGRLDAPRPPVLGERGEVLLYRDSSVPLAVAQGAAAAANDEVTGMMQRWGYAQGKK